MCRLCPIRNVIQRCPPVKRNLRWKGPNSIYNFHHHSINEGVVHCSLRHRKKLCIQRSIKGSHVHDTTAPSLEVLETADLKDPPPSHYMLLHRYELLFPMHNHRSRGFMAETSAVIYCTGRVSFADWIRISAAATRLRTHGNHSSAWSPAG
jgi:hypothetical protein